MNAQSNLRVCLVDDEARLRDVMAREISAMGHTVVAFRSAEEAWPSLRSGEFDVALLDLDLPGMSGMELFGQIRSAAPQTAIVILTGFGTVESAVQSLRWSAEDYLSKPCTLGEIERVLARVLESKRRSSGRSEASTSHHAFSNSPSIPGDSQTLEDLERERIIAALASHHGNRMAAARELAISERTLYNKLKAYRTRGLIP